MTLATTALKNSLEIGKSLAALFVSCLVFKLFKDEEFLTVRFEDFQILSFHVFQLTV